LGESPWLLVLMRCDIDFSPKSVDSPMPATEGCVPKETDGMVGLFLIYSRVQTAQFNVSATVIYSHRHA